MADPDEDVDESVDSDAAPEHDDSGKPAKPKRRRRRIVLKAAGALVATGAVGAAGYAVYDHRKRFGREAEKTIRDHRIELPTTSPRMVIARGGSPSQNAQAAIERLGGMKQFVSRDDVVIVKPNIGWDSTPTQGANTHPGVVTEVVRACREAGAKRVIVTDCPTSEARRAFERSGILKAAGEAGAEVVLPEQSSYHRVKLSDRLGTWDVLAPFVEATKIINVPIGKHHTFTGVTAGMKNWIGITTKRRMTFHADINRSIAELSALMLPTLTVVDASRVLMRNGPRGGNLADVKIHGALAAGTDPIALDAWAWSLMDSPDEELPGYLKLGEQMGLGQVDYRSLRPIEIAVG